MLTRLLPFLLLVCVLLFAAGTLLRAGFLDYSDDDTGLMRDHFITAIVAKNLVGGHGWSTSGYETFPLNPEALTIGPTVVLPLAGAIAVFGNTLAVPGLAMATLTLTLLLVLVWQSRRYWPDTSQYALFMLPALALFAALYPHAWYRAIGEIPATLLLTCAALLIARSLRDNPYLDWKTALTAGLLAGLAATSKQLALLACAGLVLATWLLVAHRQHIVAHGRNSLLLCLGMALPSGFFALYQQLFVQSLDPAWWAGTEYFRARLFEYYSGWVTVQHYLDPQKSLWPQLIDTVKTNFSLLQKYMIHPSIWPHSWLLWPVLLLLNLWWAWRQRQQNPLIALLLAAALPLLLWFFLIAPFFHARYMLMAAYLIALSCMASAADLPGYRRTVASLGLVLLCLGSQIKVYNWYTDANTSNVLLSWPREPSGLYRSMENTSRYIEANPDLRISTFAYLTVNSFEYLSPRHNIFFSGMDELARHAVFDEETYLAAYPEVAAWIKAGRYPNGKSHFMHPDTSEQYHGRFRLPYDIQINMLMDFGSNLKSVCPSSLYSDAYHTILTCNNGDILKMTGGVLTVRPQLWMRPHRIYPHEGDIF